jgi:hypothetical protein
MKTARRLLLLVLLAAPVLQGCWRRQLDTDRDRIPDVVEDANRNGRVDPGETDPRKADTDGDGLADGVEDANRDGRRDPGETSPRRGDTDGDGLSDGLEDQNRNGQVDPGETSPRLADTDGDGLDDGLEDENRNGRREPWETSPLSADTDHDAVSDGAEDANRNGRLDPGETSPVLACPTWGPDGRCAPSVPEPMVVDLVRGLGARQGEVEANVLAVLRLEDGRLGLAWAPELEWTFAHGWAAEVELPFHGTSLDAVKLALQGTVAVTHGGSAVQGLQLLGEASLDEPALSLTGYYLLSARLSPRWSANVIAGPSVRLAPGERAQLQALLSPSIFADVTPGFTLGAEGQLLLSTRAGLSATLLPQLRWRPHHALLVQLGLGVALDGAGATPVAGTRVAVEF